MGKLFKEISVRNLWYTNFFTILALVVGIIFTAKPDILEPICLIAGGLLSVIGIGLLIYYFAKKRIFPIICFYSIFFLISGILLGIIPSLLKFLIPVLFGAWILTSSAAGMFNNFAMRSVHPFWWLGFLLCLAGLVIGIFVITRPVTVMESTVRLIGIAMIVHSATRLLSILFGRKYQQTGSTPDDVIETTAKE